MRISTTAFSLSLLLALAPLPLLAEGEAPPLTMEQIEAAWAANDFVTVRQGLKALAEGPESTPFAQYRYGRVLLEGRGGPADLMGAAEWLQKASDAGQVDAMVLLARLLLSRAQGGPEFAPEKAAGLFRGAAARGNAEAQFYLGLLHAKGTGVAQSAEEAVTWLTAAAEAGHVAAMFELSRTYSQGGNTEAALKWLRAAAENGHAEAQFYLAYALDSGQGVAQDKAESQGWLLRSAEAGFLRAQGTLGRKYLNGDAVERNPGEGVRWLGQAAQRGDVVAMTDLAEALLGVEGIPPNPVQAAQLLLRAADDDYPRAMLRLGQLLEVGYDGQPADMEKAVDYWRKAVEAGSEEAVLLLGQRAGEGKLEGLLAPHRAVPWAFAAAQAGDEGALTWLKGQAEGGLRPARTAYGLWLLEKGDAVEEAAGLFESAASEGDVEAQHQLGLLHIKGEGVEQDYVAAHKWLNIAAAGGSSAALEMRGVVADLMTPEQIAQAQTLARTFFDEARPPVPAGGDQ